jgi:Protein of unknown function (DUF5674)
VPDIEIVIERITIGRLRELAEAVFGEFVKAVVDLGRGVMAVGGELHADAEAVLLDDGAAQPDLWGINLYPDAYPAEDWIEFDSMINVRPRQSNRTRDVEDPARRRAIRAVVDRLVEG